MGGMKVSELEFMRLLPAFMRDDEAAIALSKAMNRLIGEPSKRLKTISVWGEIDNLTEKECDDLAWELDIDWYNDNYPMKVKRNLIKTSIKVHKSKGTVYAVETALSALYPDCKVVEWFEYDGKPFTFRVCINATNNVPIRNKVELLKIIVTYKRLSAHLEIIIYIFEYWIKWLIDYENRLTMISSFYPRGNVAELFMDGEGCLDGTYCLDGLKKREPFDFYPTRLWMLGELWQKCELLEWLYLSAEIPFPMYIDQALQVTGRFYPRHNILLLLLNGEHSLDEYGKEPEFEFYPAVFKVLGNCGIAQAIDLRNTIFSRTLVPTKSSLHCLTIRAKADIEVEANNKAQILGEVREPVLTGKEQLTIEKDLWYLDGKQLLDGTVYLDADIYEVQL